MYGAGSPYCLDRERNRRVIWMNCCKCEKEIDTSKNDLPPKWYELMCGDKCLAVICSACLAIPGNREWWHKQTGS